MSQSFQALQIDQTNWGQIRVTGRDRVRFLQGMCTGNVEAIDRGGWLRTMMLTVKGRLVSVFDVVAGDDHMILICEPAITAKTIDALRKYAIVDDVEFVEENRDLHRIWATPADVWHAPPVFDVAPVAADADAVEVRRVEAGWPRYGVDISEDYFPFETPLARYVDYEKGCYVGQEPVARVHSRGSGNRVLRGLLLEGDAEVTLGAVVSHPQKAKAGHVTSAAISPVLGSIALAYLSRDTWDPGLEVTVDGRQARVAQLPMTAEDAH